MRKTIHFAFFFLLLLSSIPPGSSGIIDIINQLIVANLPKLNTLLHDNIPETVGDCNENSAPAPCLCTPGCAELYSIHKSWEYKANARWLSGLRSGNITSAVFAETNNGAVLTVDIQGLFTELPLSLYIGECLTFDQCVKLWDNTEGCCGNNKHFQADVAVDCKNTYPYLNNIRLTGLTLDKFEITEKVVGIKINLDDITNTIEAAVSKLLTQYLTTEAFIPLNGSKVNLLTFANFEIQNATHGGFACPSSLKEMPKW